MADMSYGLPSGRFGQWGDGAITPSGVPDTLGSVDPMMGSDDTSFHEPFTSSAAPQPSGGADPRLTAGGQWADSGSGFTGSGAIATGNGGSYGEDGRGGEHPGQHRMGYGVNGSRWVDDNSPFANTMALEDGGVVPGGQGAESATLDPMQVIQAALSFGRKKMGLPQQFYPADADGEQDGAIQTFEAGGEVSDSGVLPTGGEATAPNPQAALAYLTGDGAVAPDIAHALEQHIDPQGAMDPAERVLSALTAAPTDEARFGLLQHYRSRYNALSAGAKAALAGSAKRPPNMGQAAAAATQAFENVPTGHSVKFAPAPGGITMMAKPVGQSDTQQGFDDGGEVEEEDTTSQGVVPDVTAAVTPEAPAGDESEPAGEPVILSPSQFIQALTDFDRLLEGGFKKVKDFIGTPTPLYNMGRGQQSAAETPAAQSPVSYLTGADKEAALAKDDTTVRAAGGPRAPFQQGVIPTGAPPAVPPMARSTPAQASAPGPGQSIYDRDLPTTPEDWGARDRAQRQPGPRALVTEQMGGHPRGADVPAGKQVPREGDPGVPTLLPMSGGEAKRRGVFGGGAAPTAEEKLMEQANNIYGRGTGAAQQRATYVARMMEHAGDQEGKLNVAKETGRGREAINAARLEGAMKKEEFSQGEKTARLGTQIQGQNARNANIVDQRRDASGNRETHADARALQASVNRAFNSERANGVAPAQAMQNVANRFNLEVGQVQKLMRQEGGPSAPAQGTPQGGGASAPATGQTPRQSDATAATVGAERPYTMNGQTRMYVFGADGQWHLKK